MDRSEILQRFEQWLDTAVAEEGPPQGIPAEILAGDAAAESSPTDWYTMWAAMTALTQEVKLQGRAFKQLSETLAAEAERRGRKESLGALLEIRERLLRGLEGVRGRAELRPGFWDRIFARRWRQVEHALGVVRALEDGYRMSLAHLDDMLSQFQVQPIACEGRPFDPRRMHAVDAEETDVAAEGTVLFVYRAGYEWNGELYRPAQVRVAKKREDGGSAMSDPVVGIDLGTTNSEVAAFVEGRVRVLGPNPGKMLPSCVGIAPSGELLVGEAALNQQRIYPERTVRSIKRKMGSAETVMMAGKGFSPQEISALILKELAEWARRELGQPVTRAVITVPAYFSDAQRNATREAGTLAGLEVLRIINEPTAASLAYGYADGARHTVMVYDLGGGTFDVSIVTIEGDVTEVLSSHGNNRLGGDDFDDLLAARLEREFHQQHGIQLGDEHRAARARLWWAAEAAKKQLSFEPYARVREEALVVRHGKQLHLDVELSREEYEGMILPLVESTLDSVSKALDDAGKRSGELDAILLVGGSTRTPLVSRLLHGRTGLDPRQDVHPDLGVALGAGVLASRLAGRDVDRVLVDVSPYSFGPSYLGERGGVPYPHCYHPLIRRNTPLPVTRTESYYTSFPGQTRVDIQIFQGDDPDALNNVLVGDFRVEGLTRTEGLNEVLCRMSLDVEGILHVSAIEKLTGKSKQITIAGALQAKSDAEIAAARERLEKLFTTREETFGAPEDGDLEDNDEVEDDRGAIEIETDARPVEAQRTNGKAIPIDENWAALRHEAVDLLRRSQALAGRMHAEDKEEATTLQEAIEAAVARHDAHALGEAVRSLKELLFFVEGA